MALKKPNATTVKNERINELKSNVIKESVSLNKSNRNRYSFNINDETHRRLKIHCASTGELMSDFLEKAINNELNAQKN
jgi:hypothetical protein